MLYLKKLPQINKPTQTVVFIWLSSRSRATPVQQYQYPSPATSVFKSSNISIQVQQHQYPSPATSVSKSSNISIQVQQHQYPSPAISVSKSSNISIQGQQHQYPSPATSVSKSSTIIHVQQDQSKSSNISIQVQQHHYPSRSSATPAWESWFYTFSDLFLPVLYTCRHRPYLVILLLETSVW